jgi:FkbM family methyltransferase
VRRFYRRFIRPGDLVFDVGANTGARTAVFRVLGARVIAVEPQPGCVRALEARFGGDPLVRVVAAGLAAAPGTMPLAICDEAPTISTMSAAWREKGRFAAGFSWTHTEMVPVTTLDALIAEHGEPAFCKIDVEGYERGVLEGLSRPIPHVSFEFTREFLEETAACVRRLEGLGGCAFNAVLGESMRFMLPDDVSGESLLSLLATHPDPMVWGDVHARRGAVRVA